MLRTFQSQLKLPQRRNRLSRSFTEKIAVIACAIACLCAAPAARAGQFLIRPGDDWQSLAPRIRPGDEIILMPGRHRSAMFDSLIGTFQKPITIRSADPENPSTIFADREGIRVRHAAHLIIKNLNITGGTINGITLDAAKIVAIDEQNTPGDVLIRNVSISKVGPRGQRHGIFANNLTNLRIEDCRFEGWGGSGIEVIACNDVMISRCAFTRLEGFSQNAGIRARAGSQNVEISECRFENAGIGAIVFGAESNADEFRAGALENAREASLFEVSRARVQHCLIVGGQCAIALINTGDCLIRNNTIVRPTQFVFSMLAQQTDPRFNPGERSVFGMNMIVWQAGELKQIAEVAPNINGSSNTIEANLWWSADTPEQRSKLGELPGKQTSPQINDVDPKLGGDFKPANPAAQAFGF